MNVNSTTFSRIEAAWHSYAVSVTGVSPAHREICESATGAAGTPELSRSLRWPGYLGSRYESANKKLLCVGQIHHAEMLLSTLGYIQPLLSQVANGSTDPRIMSSINKAYEEAIKQWGPWKKFAKILNPIGLTEKHIAYTNVAKCWQTLSDAPDCRKPMKACASLFPIEQLAAAIEADAIIIMSAESTLAYAGVSSKSIPLLSFPGRPSNQELNMIARKL